MIQDTIPTSVYTIGDNGTVTKQTPHGDSVIGKAKVELQIK
jgi:hypothetical protein